MGTNYYAVTNHCSACDRCDELHICKSHTTFEGHFHEEWDPETLTYKVTPWLTSWAEWRDFLRSDKVTAVRDEYGKFHEVEAFISDVESTLPDARRLQYDWVAKHERRGVGTVPGFGRDWLDADGFSFYGGEFS